MSEILFLAHRIPYPPDKGDKIRSYHLLKALAAAHTMHLATFVDDPADWQHVEALQSLCRGETCIRPLSPRAARVRSAAGLLTGEPLTLAYYRDATLRRWIRDLGGDRSLAGVFAFSACMAQYATEVALAPGAPRVLDLCDVDSDKWRQYAANHAQPMKAVYAREARTLAVAEAGFVRDFDATLVIAEPEARLLHQQAGEGGERIRVVGNGVDTDYYDPSRDYQRPVPGDLLPIVFTGAMDYHANVDGVQWFAREVFPSIRRQLPNAVFFVVGSNPSVEVRILAEIPGVTVTGRVPDVRPYLAHAAVVVAPLRIARGVQNKVLEAMAMARPIVATENALQGIPEAAQAGVCVASDPNSMAAAVCVALTGSTDGSRSRECVRKHYGWGAHLESVVRLFDRVVSPAAPAKNPRTALA